MLHTQHFFGFGGTGFELGAMPSVNSTQHYCGLGQGQTAPRAVVCLLGQ
jgi:hypothetical protein